MKFRVTTILEVDEDILSQDNWGNLEVVEDLVSSAFYDLTDLKLNFIEVEKDE